jgi:exodeoxyribonuclease-3
VPVRIVTWNINSVRARADRLLAYLKGSSPDVLCLQELKGTDDQFPTEDVKAAGYHAALFGQKSYNGVAILSKTPPENVVRSITDGAEDDQARLIGATVHGVHVYSLYAPNGQAVGSDAYEYKMIWYGRLKRWLSSRHAATDPVLICGDFNVAPDDIDVWDPRLFAGHTLFTDSERRVFRELQASLGFVDLFRKHRPGAGEFSWWDYRASAFKKNQGLRIDHLLGTAPLARRCISAGVDKAAREGHVYGGVNPPSDHAPVFVELE